ncbi:MAG: pyridoxamine 5'-phosphate oxidase family protein [Candidatus Altiarchaeota archaeon]
MDQDLIDKMLEYMGSHKVARLALSDGQKPSAYTVYYLNEGLHLFFETEHHSEKVHIMEANPMVSLTIDEDYEDFREIKGIQLFGKIRIHSKRKIPHIVKAYEDKFPVVMELGGIPDNHVFVEVIPEKIYYLDYTETLGYKKVYYHDEDDKKKKYKIGW